MVELTINEQKAEFDERILDRWGNEFRFDHVKGLAEWLKNSVDAYIRADIADNDQHIFVRFVVTRGRTPSQIEVIDFVGMTHEDIVKAFKRWGDPEAANRGKFRTYGGHGNGGKFYMRQMFKTSDFVAWRDGKLNVFGFNERHKYGFAEGYEDVDTPLSYALEIADLSGLELPRQVLKKLEAGKCGFTVVRGHGLKRAQRRNSASGIVSRLKVHPQARRILKRVPVVAIVNDDEYGLVKPEEIEPKPGFEGPFVYDVPAKLRHRGEEINMTNERFGGGRLTLYTSEEPFGSHGDRGVLNCIDILGEIGCVASYRMHELGVITNPAQAEFIYGECFCPILEDPEEDSIANDREKLIRNERTEALLDWVRQRVCELTDRMAEQSEREQREQDLKNSSQFNHLLNDWKNQFMAKLYAEIFAGQGSGPGLGGEGGGGSGAGGSGKGSGDGAAGEQGDKGGGSGDEKKKAQRYPIVLISDHDTDPLHPESGHSVTCDPRHPPVYQRHEDVVAGIYWINSQAPFAQRTIDEFGSESTQWRDYMFQRYVDIIVKQAIYEAEKRTAELTATGIDSLLDDIHKRVYAEASDTLKDFLFDEKFGRTDSWPQVSGITLGASDQTHPVGGG